MNSKMIWGIRIVIGLALAISGYAAGIWLLPLIPGLANNQSEQLVENKLTSQSFYYLKEGSLWRVSSDNLEPQRLPIAAISLDAFASFSDPEEVIYYLEPEPPLSAAEIEKRTNNGAPAHLSMAIRKHIVKTGADEAIYKPSNDSARLYRLSLSSNGKRLAFFEGEPVANPDDWGVTEDTFLVVLDLETQQTQRISYRSDKEMEYYIFRGQNLTWSSENDVFATLQEWESLGHCWHDLNPNADTGGKCQRVGSNFIGMSRIPLGWWNGMYYEIAIKNNLMDSSSPTNNGAIYARSTADIEKDGQRLESSLAKSGLLHQGKIFTIEPTSVDINVAGTDIFMYDIANRQRMQLTSVSGSGAEQAHLRISPNGRYLTYIQFYAADIPANKRSYGLYYTDSYLPASSVFVYDLELGVSYPIAEQALL